MLGPLIEPAIKALIEARNFTALHQVFADWPPADLPTDEQAIVPRGNWLVCLLTQRPSAIVS